MVVSEAPDAPVLLMRGITKFFGSVRANYDINLDLQHGEILGLLGENGAGKSTLMSILFGLQQADAGTIELRGRTVDISSPADALSHGIGMVHQHFMVIPAFTVAENLVLGAEPTRHHRLDWARARHDVETLAERFGLQVNAAAKVSTLSVGAQQRVEILRALYRGARILILDEPTAVLTPQESESLFKVLRRMAEEGMSVILISHKLDELLSVTERITVIRDGEVVSTVPSREATPGQLATLMVGRPTELTLEVPPAIGTRAPLLRLSQVTVEGDRVDHVDLTLHAGEIVGVAGVEGSGQTELGAAIAGVKRVESGSIHLMGQDITHMGARARLKAGLAYVPEDRRSEGLVQDFTIYENAVLRRQRRPPFQRRGFLRPKAMQAFAQRLVEQADVRPRKVDVMARTLSGGNQQKLLIAREMADDPLVIVVTQPTRGVDIAATGAIHRQLLAARQAGKAVLVISLDLDEIKALSDRIVVMFRGRIVGELRRGEATDEAVGLLMAGVTEAGSAPRQASSEPRSVRLGRTGDVV